jgi:metal-dependent amidase/aminoacylase/carboxypeptidase family protein
LQVEYTFSEKPYLNLVTNKRMADVFRSNAEMLGVKFESLDQPFGGSTDMGNVSYTVPSIHPFYALETKGANHTKEFTVASGLL